MNALRWCTALGAVALLLVSPSTGYAASSSDEPVLDGAPGCCPNPAQNELQIDVLDYPNDPDLDVFELIGDFFQVSHSVVFPPETVPPAPNFPHAYVWLDDARPDQCDILLARQWAISGEPHFVANDGDEIFQFWNEEPMVVNRVRLSVGYNNGSGTVTVTAYDCEGNVLESYPNSIDKGFEEFEFDRTHLDPDIHYVRVEAPDDPQGVGINCIRFPQPVPCKGAVSVEPETWGRVKSSYR